MGHVQPFVAIVLGDGPQPDAEQLARAAGATAILRPGQPHAVPLHTPDAVIDLAAPDHDDGVQDAVIDLAQADERTGQAPDTVIDLITPDHSEQPSPVRMPDAAVVIDPAAVADVPALVAAVHRVLGRLTPVGVACVVGVRTETGTRTLLDGAGVRLGVADLDAYRWAGALLAGPLEVLGAVAEQQAGPPAGSTGPAGVRPWIEALIEGGVEIRVVPVSS